MNIPRLTNFLFEIGSLRKIARSHRQSFWTDDLSDSISSHSYRVTVIAYFLAKAEKANIKKTVLMALFHDSGESRSGDQNWVHKKYVKVYEDEIIEDQLKDLVEDDELFNLVKEYSERKSLEAKVAKDADKLDQFFLIREYMLRGNKEAENWIRPQRREEMYTETAKKLFDELCKTSPADWWKDIYTEERRK